MKQHEHCPFCGELEYHHQTRPLQLKYKGQSITVNQPGFWCNTCGEGVIDSADRKITQKQLQAFRAKIDGLLTPDEIKLIRQKLHIRQREAGEMFGGGINAFSRYERGETPVPKAVSLLLILLNQHPNLFSEINKHKKKVHK